MTQEVQLEDPDGSPTQTTLDWNVPVEPVEGGGQFTVSGLLRGAAVVAAGEHVARLDVERPESAIAIDLSQPVAPQPQRRVVLRFVTPDGALRPTGSIQVQVIRPEQGRSADVRHLPIDTGEVTLEVAAPSQVFYRATSVIGYWFTDGDFPVEPARDPLRVDVRAVPAGAIVGQVLEPDGTPAVSDVRLSCRAIEKPPEVEDKSIMLNNIAVDSEEPLLPLALAARWHVSSWSPVAATTSNSASPCGSTVRSQPGASCSGCPGRSQPRGA